MTYDPKFSQKQMYDQYGRSRTSTKKVNPKTRTDRGFTPTNVAPPKSKPNPGKQFADSMKAGGGGKNMSGIGAKPVSIPFEQGSTYDEIPTSKPSKPKDPSNIEKVKNKFIELMKFFGAEDPKEVKVDGKAVYKGPMFKPYEGRIVSSYPFMTMKEVGNNIPIDVAAMDARIRDAVDYSKAPPLVYTAYGSTYDEIPPFSANKNLVKNAVNTFLKQRGLGGKEYTIKRGDTLSEIAQREGVTVDDLAKINKIEDKDRIYTGETLIIPPPQEIERVKDLVDSVDPDAKFSQSGVPMDQRIFEPELGYDEIPLPSQATIDKKIKGLGARPEVTVTELDAASDTADLNNPQTREGISFISTPAIDNIYEEIGDSETTTAHLGESDFEDVGITLGYGIVPTSGLKYEHNGTVIELPDNEAERWNTLSNAGVTRQNFNPDNVITDDVVKDGVRRDRYDTDESFTKAVIKQFQDRVETSAERQGVDADDIPEGAMTGLVAYSYNTGESHNYNDMEPVYEELTRGANANMTTVQDGMLQTFTTGGIVKQGMANRRRTDYNHVAEALGQPTITHKTNRRLANGNAGFEFEFSDGTTRTFDTGKRYNSASVSQADFKDDLNVRQAVN